MWVIIDGNNWFSRAWFALKPTTSQDPEVIKHDLEQRSARSIQTTLRWIEDANRQLNPTTLAICWDSSTSFRKKACPAYKDGREKPDGYHSAMSVLRDNLQDYRQCEQSGYEADDLLAGFARDAIDEGEKCLLCSSDKDLHQCLVAGMVSQCTDFKRSLINSNRLEFQVLTYDGLLKQYGVSPWQWIDYRCISGDSSDGLPGAPGIGPKTACSVLVACQTLDEFYKEPFKAPITIRQRNILLEFQSQIPLMRDLITLRPDSLYEEVK